MLVIGFMAINKPDKLKHYVRLGIVSLIITAVLLPLVSTVRMASIYNDWSLSYLDRQFSYYSEKTMSILVLRITGAEGAALAMSNIDFDKVNAWDVYDRGVVSYYTREVLRVPDTGKSGFTPSALGEVKLLFGSELNYLAILLWPVLIILFNRLAEKKLKHLYPIGFGFILAFSVKSLLGGVFAMHVYILIGSLVIVFILTSHFRWGKRLNSRVHE